MEAGEKQSPGRRTGGGGRALRAARARPGREMALTEGAKMRGLGDTGTRKVGTIGSAKWLRTLNVVPKGCEFIFYKAP